MINNLKRETILSCRNLCKNYHMGNIEIKALREVSLEIQRGEFISLLGPSGSGKSTLLNILGALDRPTSGDVYFYDLDHENNKRITINLSKSTDNQQTEFRRQHVGFVFQMYNLIPRLTAEENVQLVTDICKKNTHQIPMSPIEALHLVGLSDRRHHFPSQLSGGEQQRVAIARAISKRPEILFCDEPTGALDVKTGLIVLNVLKEVNEKLNTTTIIITHNISISQMADRVIKLSDGKIEKITVNANKLHPNDLKW